MNSELYTPNKIRTFSGKFVDPLNMSKDDICIEDIAHALSQIPRFGGHLPKFYSVAEHCIRGARMIEESQSLAFLLHDAGEAYLLDLPSPIKHRLPEYKAAEESIMELIEEVFGVDLKTPEVKEVDKVMVEAEWKGRMLNERPDVASYNPPMAEKLFLQTFKELSK